MPVYTLSLPLSYPLSFPLPAYPIPYPISYPVSYWTRLDILWVPHLFKTEPETCYHIRSQKISAGSIHPAVQKMSYPVMENEIEAPLARLPPPLVQNIPGTCMTRRTIAAATVPTAYPLP